MKVILLQSIKGRGQKGDIIEVSDGFAQNSLIPQGLAKVATAQEINKLKLAKESVVHKQEKEKERTLNLLKAINGKTIVIREKLNEKGTLYHALGIKEITNAVQEQLQFTLPHELYTEKYALKEAGNYTLKLSAHNTKAEFFVVVTEK